MPSAGDAKVLGINSLPAELLLKILTSLCGPFETQYRSSLLAVCSRWRQLLLATPTIWRSIYIVSSEWRSQDVYERFLLRLEAHLIRSQSRRLKVLLDIEQPQEGESSPDSGFEPDLKPLARLLERWAPFPAWETLDLWQCSQGMANELHLDRMGGFINLEHLYLNSLFDPLLPILTNTITNTFQRFDCRSSHCPFDGQTYVHSIHSLLSRITWLKLPNTFNGSTTGLKLPPNITAACIVGNIPDANFPYVRSVEITPFHVANSIPALPIRFPNLQSLKLTIFGRPCIPAISPIEFPNLEHLTTQLSAYSLLGHLSSPRLQTLTVCMMRLETLFPSWTDEIHQSHSSEPVLSKIFLETNLQPEQEFSLLVPVPFHVLNAALCCATKVKKLGVLFNGRDDNLKALSTLFHWGEEECTEAGENNQAAQWQLPLHLEYLDLFLNCRLDEEMSLEWSRCVGRFLAWRSAGVQSLRTIQVAWKCGETRRIVV